MANKVTDEQADVIVAVAEWRQRAASVAYGHVIVKMNLKGQIGQLWMFKEIHLFGKFT